MEDNDVIDAVLQQVRETLLVVLCLRTVVPGRRGTVVVDMCIVRGDLLNVKYVGATTIGGTFLSFFSPTRDSFGAPGARLFPARPLVPRFSQFTAEARSLLSLSLSALRDEQRHSQCRDCSDGSATHSRGISLFPVSALSAYNAHSEVFVVVSLTLFLPICLEQFASDNGFLDPDHTTPCVSSAARDDGARCSVKIGWLWIDTASFRFVSGRSFAPPNTHPASTSTRYPSLFKH